MWSTLTILSLFAGTVMASPQTLRAASGSLGSVSSASMEKNNMETPSLAAWNHRNGRDLALFQGKWLGEEGASFEFLIQVNWIFETSFLSDGRMG